MTNPNPGVRDHAPPGPERLLAGLTPEQAQAVTFGTGPLLVAGRAGRRQDQDAHAPRRLSARERAGAAVGDPRGHVQRPRRRRAAAAARRPARRDRRARGDGGDVPLGVRAAAARARRRVRPHRALHDLRPGGHAPRDRLAAVRRRARRDPAGAGRLRAAGERRGARRDLAREERAADPGRVRALGHTSGRAADRRGVARERDASCGAATRSSSTTCSPARSGCSSSTRTGSRGCGSGGGGSWPTSSRTPATRRRCSSTCSPARTGTCAWSETTTS